MSTTMHVICLRADNDKFQELGFVEAQCGPEQQVCQLTHDAGTAEIAAAVLAIGGRGVIFHARIGANPTTGATLIASSGSELVSVMADQTASAPIVRVNADGSVGSTNNAHAYWRVLAAVQARTREASSCLVCRDAESL